MATTYTSIESIATKHGLCLRTMRKLAFTRKDMKIGLNWNEPLLVGLTKIFVQENARAA